MAQGKFYNTSSPCEGHSTRYKICSDPGLENDQGTKISQGPGFLQGLNFAPSPDRYAWRLMLQSCEVKQREYYILNVVVDIILKSVLFYGYEKQRVFQMYQIKNARK